MIAEPKTLDLVLTNNEKVTVELQERPSRHVSRSEGVSPNNTVLYVHVDGITVLRIYCNKDEIDLDFSGVDVTIKQ